MLAAGGLDQLLAQLADEDIDDLELRLVHAAVEMIEEHLLGQGRALAQAEKLHDLVLLAGQMDRPPLHLHGLGVQVHVDPARGDDRLRVPLGAADDGVDARDQLLAVERLGHVVVGAETEAAHLALRVVLAGQDQDRRIDPGHAKLAQHLVPIHVRQVQIEEDQVVVVELRQVDPFLAQIGDVGVEVRMGEHQLDAAGGGRIVFDEKDTHRCLQMGRASSPSFPKIR